MNKKGWKEVEDLEKILTKEGYHAYINSDYYVFQNIYTGLYRITVHDNPVEDSNIVYEELNELYLIDFFTETYEECFED